MSDDLYFSLNQAKKKLLWHYGKLSGGFRAVTLAEKMTGYCGLNTF